jgi:hypothetical protein
MASTECSRTAGPLLCLFTIAVLVMGGVIAPQGGVASAQAMCTLVELYPGYPGYRGMITGLKGVGDFQCLETLKAQDPTFDRSEEDAKNRSAAQSLGIRGTFNDWTWENWMGIEVSRGLIPQCYACLLLDPSAYPLSSDARVAPDDPRLLIGMTVGAGIERYILDELGIRPTGASKEGIYWRVGAAFAYPDFTLNAPETLDGIRFLVGEWYGYDMDGDGQFSTLTINKAQETFLLRGGYATMTGEESYEDQVYQAIAVAYLMTNSGMPGLFQTGITTMYQDAIDQCRFDSAGYRSVGHCVADRVVQ